MPRHQLSCICSIYYLILYNGSWTLITTGCKLQELHREPNGFSALNSDFLAWNYRFFSTSGWALSENLFNQFPSFSLPNIPQKHLEQLGQWIYYFIDLSVGFPTHSQTVLQGFFACNAGVTPLGRIKLLIDLTWLVKSWRFLGLIFPNFFFHGKRSLSEGCAT